MFSVLLVVLCSPWIDYQLARPATFTSSKLQPISSPRIWISEKVMKSDKTALLNVQPATPRSQHHLSPIHNGVDKGIHKDPQSPFSRLSLITTYRCAPQIPTLLPHRYNNRLFLLHHLPPPSSPRRPSPSGLPPPTKRALGRREDVCPRQSRQLFPPNRDYARHVRRARTILPPTVSLLTYLPTHTSPESKERSRVPSCSSCPFFPPHPPFPLLLSLHIHYQPLLISQQLHNLLPLRKRPHLTSLPRRARPAPLPHRRRALHRMQALRSHLPSASHHDRSRGARRRQPPHNALRHRHDQVYLLRVLPGELSG